MRKIYPYLANSYWNDSQTNPFLENPYNYNLNDEQNKRDILSLLDKVINQRQYVNITLLDWEERPLKEIDGIISSGSISKDGNSSVRRTASLSCSVDGGSYNIDSLQMDFALNKKVFIEIGIKNDTGLYSDYPILWFPQGVFYINSFSINSSTSSAVNLTLNLKDKMCLLNGDVGGTLPAAVQFDIMTTQLADGTITDQKVLYYNIITELVNHWGEEDLNNIIIQDVPLRIRKVVAWNGENPIWLKEDRDNDGNAFYQIQLTNPGNSSWSEYSQGDDIGYVYSDFVPVSEITGAAGDSVCTILDTIKSQLGNYEYFYDVYGIFHFREIRNYLNVTQSNIDLQESSNLGRKVNLEEGQFLLDSGSELQYLVETTNDKTVYSFSDDTNITSITVTPNYENIKNDFIINGIRESTTSDVQYSIRYRCVIDDIPEKNSNGEYDTFENILYYTYPEYYEGQVVAETNVLGKYLEVITLPNVGNMDQIYKVIDDNTYWMWTGQKYEKLYLKENESLKEPIIYDTYTPKDWRTLLYLRGLEANISGLDPGPYFQDLNSFWPLEYDLKQENQKFFGEEEDGTIYYKTLAQGNFFFDMIDASTSSLGGYSVKNIGRRVDSYIEDDINCLFAPEIPNVVFLNSDNPFLNWSENTSITELQNSSLSVEEMLGQQKAECNSNSQPWVQVPNNIYSDLVIGGYLNSAYEALRYELFSHTKYQKVVSLTAIPVFYLEPNSRVSLSDYSTNTFGDFMVQNINLSLGPGANMTVSLNEVSERL